MTANIATCVSRTRPGTVDTGDTITGQHIGGYIQGEVQDIELTSGGRFDFCEYNFYAGTDTKRLYGCNGINPPFEFDGNTLLPILMPDDSDINNPRCIEVHKDQLFLGFASGLVRHSIVGEPLNFNGQLGAAELGTGDTVTDIKSITGGVLAIASRNRLHALYGDNSQNWQMKTLGRETGAMPGSLQSLGDTYMLDDAGIVALSRVEAFGDFEHSTVSRLVQPLINRLKNQCIGSVTYRDENHIRFYFSGGDVVVFKPETNAPPQIMPLRYPVAMNSLCSVEDEEGRHTVYFGTVDGWVMKDQQGGSFDGEPIESFMRTAYNHLQSPTLRKAFKRLEVDYSGYQTTTLQGHIDIDYAAHYTPSPLTTRFAIHGPGGQWDSAVWHAFNWSSQDVGYGSLSVTGTGKNLSIAVYHKDADTLPFSINGLVIHYIPRRMDRG